MTVMPKVPAILKKELYWFGSIIGRPIDEDSKMNPISPTGKPMEIEAIDHIAPSPTLRPAERIQIYNQQYWWRLLTILHDTFPLLVRLFGYYDFNRLLGIPYIVKYRPKHWSLNYLGDRLAKWIEEEYHAKDKQLILDAARIDVAFSDSFVCKELDHIDQSLLVDAESLEKFALYKLYTQPHLHLFEMDYHIFHYRDNFMLQAPDYWLENDFPILEKERKYFFALYRNLRKEISWKEITFAEYHLLKFFEQGSSIEDICEWLEGQEETLCNFAMNHLQQWFNEWTRRGWLTTTEPSAAS